ncbi:hypothetical protein ACFW95_37155 [Streptomyces sp. NPDC059474]|uniref:hypothetical protein n=1 Tax=unclassified Streptomyces TaxID=2593676 RepID=UPI00340E305C
MPQFVLLVHEDEAAWESAEQKVRDRIVEQHYEFSAAHKDVLVDGNEFQSTAVSVDVRGGKVRNRTPARRPPHGSVSSTPASGAAQDQMLSRASHVPVSTMAL